MKHNATDPLMYTDDQLLYNCFDMLIHRNNTIHMNLTNNPSYMVRDGFLDKIDECLLSPFMYSLAKRCGYKLVDGMWVRRTVIDES